MSPRDAILLANADGLSVTLRPDGTPALSPTVPGARPRPATLEALKACRAGVIELLAQRRREWIWNSGHRHLEEWPLPADWHPTGAWWWRFEGELSWRPVEGLGDVKELARRARALGLDAEEVPPCPG